MPGERKSTLDTIATVPCTCSGTISYCEDEDGDAVVVHTMPFCAWFERATISDYRALLEEHPEAKALVMAKKS